MKTEVISTVKREDAGTTIGAELIQNGEHPPKEILLVDYEPVTGAHVGPGALALFFESCPGVRAVKGLDTIPESLKALLSEARAKIARRPVRSPAQV